MLVSLELVMFVALMTSTAGILIHGVGLSSSQNACESGIFVCIWLYALTKVFIYAFLGEKARVVWNVAAQPRLSSPVYLVCILVMLPFGAMPIMLTIGRIAFFRSDMTCIIGLKAFSSLTLLGYDLFTNVFLNEIFLWPLLRSKLINHRLRAVARRTLLAAMAALATSITNVAVLTALKHELGWVCLGSCTTDATLNALVIFWLTMPTPHYVRSDPSLQLARLSTYQQSSSKPETEHATHSTTFVKAPLVTFAPTTLQKPRASPEAPLFSKSVNVPVPCQARIAETHGLQYTTILPDLPLSPTLVSASYSNMSILAGSPGDDLSSARRSSGLCSVGELFGLSMPKPEQDMEVHVSVVTERDLELGELEGGGANQAGR
ncbi:hypothetical protein OPQ81_008117 [Rhizoctonia solani]|nr:hypothetical protein OPQ81_008117 [Rhizoctonia solani]